MQTQDSSYSLQDAQHPDAREAQGGLCRFPPADSASLAVPDTSRESRGPPPFLSHLGRLPAAPRHLGHPSRRPRGDAGNRPTPGPESPGREGAAPRPPRGPLQRAALPAQGAGAPVPPALPRRHSHWNRLGAAGNSFRACAPWSRRETQGRFRPAHATPTPGPRPPRQRTLPSPVCRRVRAPIPRAPATSFSLRMRA